MGFTEGKTGNIPRAGLAGMGVLATGIAIGAGMLPNSVARDAVTVPPCAALVNAYHPTGEITAADYENGHATRLAARLGKQAIITCQETPSRVKLSEIFCAGADYTIYRRQAENVKALQTNDRSVRYTTRIALDSEKCVNDQTRSIKPEAYQRLARVMRFGRSQSETPKLLAAGAAKSP